MYNRIIIKIGTATLTRNKSFIDKKYLASFVKTISALHKEGKEIVIVTSGAVGAGREFLKMDYSKNKSTSKRQIFAAVGQVYLMKTYWEYFQKNQITTAQALLIREDFNNRKRFLNIRNTLLALLKEKVIPIINENDVVYTEELEGTNFGDNDTLCSLLATAVNPDLVIILSDIDGLFTGNPKIDKKAKLIRVVDRIDASLNKMVQEDNTKAVGFGGMSSKIKAAKIITSYNAELVIAKGDNPKIIIDIIGNKEKKSTRFLPESKKKSTWKKWLANCVVYKNAKVFIDQKAEQALLNDKSLLPVGVTKTNGKANRGDPVEIYSEKNKLVAKGLLEYSIDDLDRIKKHHSDEIDAILGYFFGEEAIHKDNLIIIE